MVADVVWDVVTADVVSRCVVADVVARCVVACGVVADVVARCVADDVVVNVVARGVLSEALVTDAAVLITVLAINVSGFKFEVVLPTLVVTSGCKA